MGRHVMVLRDNRFGSNLLRQSNRIVTVGHCVRAEIIYTAPSTSPAAENDAGDIYTSASCRDRASRLLLCCRD
jgi:hypothetical protein